MQLQSGLCSEPRWISWLYSAFPDPLADFKGSTSKRGKGEGEGREIEEKRQGERERERRETV